MKICSKCKIEKDFNEFNKHPKGKNGLYPSCKSCCIISTLEWKEKNKDKYDEYRKKYYNLNKEQYCLYLKNYNLNNKEILNKKRVQYRNNRRKNDSIFKFGGNIRSLIGSSFKRGNNNFKKNSKTESILGCTIKEFRLYIEKQFVEGMSFDNHGKWHLDHIIPIASATTEEEIIKLNHYTNFQPLWAEENIRKGNRLDY